MVVNACAKPNAAKIVDSGRTRDVIARFKLTRNSEVTAAQMPKTVGLRPLNSMEKCRSRLAKGQIYSS